MTAEATETAGFAVGTPRRPLARLPMSVLPCLTLTVACASPLPRLATTGAEPPGDVRQEALIAARDTRLDASTQLRFAWSAREPDFRWSGFGVARVEPPYKARLDLFLDNGETAATAALVGDDLRIPTALPTQLVPPPALLWAVLGVFRPGDGAQLLEGRVRDEIVDVGYRLPAGDHLRFRLRDGVVVDVTLLEDGAVVERVMVSAPEDGSHYPSEATYRNLRDYRELKLQLEFFEDVDSFPPDIWYPYGQ